MRTRQWLGLCLTTLCAVALFLGAAGPASADGILFIGTDEFVFNGQQSQLGKYTTSGAKIVGGSNIPLSFALNGVGEGNGFLYGGDPGTNAFRTLDFNGNLLSTKTGGFPGTSFNEDFAFNGTALYRAWWPGGGSGTQGGINQLDPVTGAVLKSFNQPNVVGMTFTDANTIWITHWSADQVGTWDPNTNTFTPVFTVNGNAGALAWDPTSHVLWVGVGGTVEPFSLTGTQLGPAFSPFGNDPDTIDGLAFIPFAAVPEPSAFALLVLGGGALAGWRRWRKRRAA